MFRKARLFALLFFCAAVFTGCAAKPAATPAPPPSSGPVPAVQQTPEPTAFYGDPATGNVQYITMKLRADFCISYKGTPKDSALMEQTHLPLAPALELMLSRNGGGELLPGFEAPRPLGELEQDSVICEALSTAEPVLNLFEHTLETGLETPWVKVVLERPQCDQATGRQEGTEQYAVVLYPSPADPADLLISTILDPAGEAAEYTTSVFRGFGPWFQAELELLTRAWGL